MRIDEFRDDPQLPFQWKKELESNRILQVVLKIMDDNAPWHALVGTDKDGDVSPTLAAIALGMNRGYAKFSDTLFNLATPTKKPASTPPTTYSDPNQQQKEPPPIHYKD